MQQQAATRAARSDDGAVASALERIAIGGERQSALTLVLAVAFEALLRQDRLHLTLEVDQRGAGPRRRLPGTQSRRPPHTANISAAMATNPGRRIEAASLSARPLPVHLARVIVRLRASSSSLSRILAALLRPALVDGVETPFRTAARRANRLAADRWRTPDSCAMTGRCVRRSSCCDRRHLERQCPHGAVRHQLLRGDRRAVDDELDRHLAVAPMRARSSSQYGFSSYVSWRIASFGCCVQLRRRSQRHLHRTRLVEAAPRCRACLLPRR